MYNRWIINRRSWRLKSNIQTNTTIADHNDEVWSSEPLSQLVKQGSDRGSAWPCWVWLGDGSARSENGNRPGWLEARLRDWGETGLAWGETGLETTSAWKMAESITGSAPSWVCNYQVVRLGTRMFNMQCKVMHKVRCIHGIFTSLMYIVHMEK